MIYILIISCWQHIISKTPSHLITTGTHRSLSLLPARIIFHHHSNSHCTCSNSVKLINKGRQDQKALVSWLAHIKHKLSQRWFGTKGLTKPVKLFGRNRPSVNTDLKVQSVKLTVKTLEVGIRRMTSPPFDSILAVFYTFHSTFKIAATHKAASVLDAC